MDLVLDALALPFVRVAPEQLGSLGLRPEQLLVVNCPGQVSREAVTNVRDFVEAGGSLFSTDWALRHLVEPAFPGTIAYNDRPTRDDVVRIEVAEADNPFLRGVIDPGEDPLWWLEGSSYPIRVLDGERVRVLVRSAELEARYGEAPVAVLFSHGRGEVFHMIGHYYLQRTELREARHQTSATAYAGAKGVAVPEEMLDELNVGDIESARFLANVVAEKKRRS